MTEDETIRRIFEIVEVDIRKKELPLYDARLLSDEITELLDSLPDGPKKDQTKKKLEDKARFTGWVNDTGIQDFTGYGRHFF
jgi:hypothetical protein